MALIKTKLSDGKWLYRCEFCQFEHPIDPVKEHELGPPPWHSCPLQATDSEDIVFDAGESAPGKKNLESEKK